MIPSDYPLAVDIGTLVILICFAAWADPRAFVYAALAFGTWVGLRPLPSVKHPGRIARRLSEIEHDGR